VWDLQEAGQFLVGNNFTFFFNIDSNGTYAVWLRTIIPFQQENGLQRGSFPYEDRLIPSAYTVHCCRTSSCAACSGTDSTAPV
jgi:hypothetical protein